MAQENYSANTNDQRQRLLERLRSAPVSTYQARIELDIFHPAARVQELRERGHKIVTEWRTCHTGKGKHRVASYVLLTDSSR